MAYDVPDAIFVISLMRTKLRLVWLEWPIYNLTRIQARLTESHVIKPINLPLLNPQTT